MSTAAGSAADFAERVRELTIGSPYLVTPRDDGFTLSLNLVDEQWYTVAFKRGVRAHIKYEVTLDESGRVFRILDVYNQLKWGGGVPGGPRVPVLSAEMFAFRGRMVGKQRSVAYGLDASDRQLRKVVDYRFTTGEGHDMIRSVGRELGWQEKLPGLVVGSIVVGCIGLLAVPLVIVLALTGNLQ